MFNKIKQALRGDPARPGAEPAAAQRAPTADALGPVSEWAATQGFAFSSKGAGQRFSIEGKVAAGKPWRMEVGRPSRAYIQGEELRARAELGVRDDVAVMVINLPLKEALEKQAYARYTDGLQTSVETNLPEEVRWLAMYEEFGWDSLPRAFRARYAVLGDQRENAEAWMDPVLANQLLTWPAPAPEASVPFMMMILRGKAYLRMQQGGGDMPTLQHAAQVFAAACESAVGAFSSGVPSP